MEAPPQGSSRTLGVLPGGSLAAWKVTEKLEKVTTVWVVFEGPNYKHREKLKILVRAYIVIHTNGDRKVNAVRLIRVSCSLSQDAELNVDVRGRLTCCIGLVLRASAALAEHTIICLGAALSGPRLSV